MSAAESTSRDPLEKLAESFLARFRNGERPSLNEYIEGHPELADDIRELFPALAEMESLKADIPADNGCPISARPAKGAIPGRGPPR
jgi:hypothetical protein